LPAVELPARLVVAGQLGIEVVNILIYDRGPLVNIVVVVLEHRIVSEKALALRGAPRLTGKRPRLLRRKATACLIGSHRDCIDRAMTAAAPPLASQRLSVLAARLMMTLWVEHTP